MRRASRARIAACGVALCLALAGLAYSEPADAGIASYTAALETWRSAEDVNAWIGRHFRYDLKRALLLSETQRSQGVRLAVHLPETFFDEPEGVCVDLAHFSVETLRAVEPQSKPRYVMIEFDPVSIAGNTLRRHWVASFER